MKKSGQIMDVTLAHLSGACRFKIWFSIAYHNSTFTLVHGTPQIWFENCNSVFPLSVFDYIWYVPSPDRLRSRKTSAPTLKISEYSYWLRFTDIAKQQ